ISLATRAGDRALFSSVAETLAARGKLLLGRTRKFAAIEIARFVAGAIALVVIVARRRDPGALSIGTSHVPPPWRGRIAAVVLVAGSLDLSSHWTEWLDEDLVWGTVPVVGTSIVEYVVMAPVFEEMVFRGLLFATLRRRFGWIGSAVISTAVFAAAHAYGALGFASVFWTGVLWAWAYEK